LFLDYVRKLYNLFPNRYRRQIKKASYGPSTEKENQLPKNMDIAPGIPPA